MAKIENTTARNPAVIQTRDRTRQQRLLLSGEHRPLIHQLRQRGRAAFANIVPDGPQRRPVRNSPRPAGPPTSTLASFELAALCLCRNRNASRAGAFDTGEIAGYFGVRGKDLSTNNVTFRGAKGDKTAVLFLDRY